MNQQGYYRFPTIHDDTVVFVSEDDLWSVPASGGTARRITSSVSRITRPLFSPDGSHLAFTAMEEGHAELYAMPAEGGEARRLTYLGANTIPVAWSRDGREIIYATNHGQPFAHLRALYAVPVDGGVPRPLELGPANSLAVGPNGGMLLGRNTHDPAHWKRYRGGTAGDFWIDANGDGNFRRLLDLHTDLASPVWIGERIYFLSDHEGFGNLYSCGLEGNDIRRHSDHDDYYARNASGDGSRIVYHAGGDLYLFDPASESVTPIEVEFHSQRTQRSRKFVDAEDYLQDYALHPDGHSIALVARGKAITMGNFVGPAVQHGEPFGTRYRLLRYLNDGQRLVATSDAGGEEALVILSGTGEESEDRLEGLDIGRPVNLEVCPTADRVAFANHRNEIVVVDLEKRQATVIDRSNTLHDSDIAWSPDGRWLAFNHAEIPETSYLMIADVESGEKHQVTEPVLHDTSPAFDPEGNYLYFLSVREFDPVFDNVHFHLSFPRGMRPYLVTLKQETENPFLPKPKPPKKEEEEMLEEMKESSEEKKKEVKVEIDFDGITRRLLPFPTRAGKYSAIVGAPKGRVYFVAEPIIGMLEEMASGDDAVGRGSLETYEFESQKLDTVAGEVSGIDISRDAKTLIYRSGKRLRVFAAGTRPEEKEGDGPGRTTGWVDLSRPRIMIRPAQEWHQMYREAWRLQRDFFWTEGMLGIDWDSVYQRYLPLIDRIGSRAEMSDIIWELQGELGTSHAYESGGDYRDSPMYQQGSLAADFAWDEKRGEWVVARIVRGDPWSNRYGSPLENPGVNVKEGDAIVSINGRAIGREHSPMEGLINTAGTEVQLAVRPAGGGDVRCVTVKPIGDDRPVRYREWVETNRRIVHEATGGKVGYVHVPNMGALGYAEFHRGFLGEVGRGGLIVDVRFNGGGFVSQLILEKLARKRIGYGLARYGQPEPYPAYSLAGPLVAITNENAGSDGDIFSHGFKLMKLGPLVGKRTWGGVVGIWPRNPLVDGSVTTQPEFSTWFEDVKWGLENYGTDPDIEVDIAPQDYAAGRDPQLHRAIEEALKGLDAKPYQPPTFEERPLMAPPPLPKREAVELNGKVNETA